MASYQKLGGHRLHAAAKFGDIEALDNELDRGVDVDLRAEHEGGATPLIFASIEGHADIMKRVLERKADPNARDARGGYTAAHYASAAGDWQMVELLWKHKADLDARDDRGWTPLIHAADHARNSAVRWLLDHKADPECTTQQDAGYIQAGMTAEHAAAKRGHFSTVACFRGLRPL